MITAAAPFDAVSPHETSPVPAFGKTVSAPRLHFVDGVRAAAMLAVVFHHVWQDGGKWPLRVGIGGHGFPIGSLLALGHAGVNLFLVLSGFCLFWPFALNPTRTLNVKNFAFRRCWRILPPYYAALISSALWVFISALRHGETARIAHTGKSFVGHALMLHNFNAAYVLDINPVMWSLALEFQLYFFFPLFFFIARKWGIRPLLYGSLVLCLLIRITLAHVFSTNVGLGEGYVLYYGVWGRFSEFVLGMFAAQLIANQHKNGKLALRSFDYAAAAVLVVASGLTLRGAATGNGGEVWFRPFTDVLFGILSVMLLCVASRPASWLNRAFSVRWLTYLGVVSYSVYLMHKIIVGELSALIETRFPGTMGTNTMMLWGILVFVPVALLLGWLFHVLVERHFLYPPGKKPSSTTLPVASGTV